MIIRRHSRHTIILFITIFLLATGLNKPVHAGKKNSTIIADAALQCGAAYFVMRWLPYRGESNDKLTTTLSKMMDDVYIVHKDSPENTGLNIRDIIKLKNNAVNELEIKYAKNPVDVESDFLWCEEWSTTLETFFTNIETYKNTKTTILAAPQPKPRRKFNSGKNSDISRLVHLAFESWISKGRITPLDEYHQILINQIHRECLRSWPGNLLKELAETRMVPIEVDTDPSLQTRLFRKYVERDMGLFYPSQLDELLQPFREFVVPGKRFLDLGSGDGRVVFFANVLGADATGIEFDSELFEASQIAMQKLGNILQADLLHFFREDFFKIPWSGYDVIFYFGLGSFDEQRIRMKINYEMEPQALLIVNKQAEAFLDMELVREFHTVKVFRKSDK